MTKNLSLCLHFDDDNKMIFRKLTHGLNLLIIIVVVVVFIKSCQNATYTQSIMVFIQHTYHKIITEELVTFVNKLSVMASCSEIVVLVCFIRELR